MKALIADDARMMRTILRRCLEAIGVKEIVEAEDGVAAIDEFRADRFDIVLTDWNMPNKNGLQLLAEIRALDAHVPVIMITTEGQKGHVTEAIQAGVTGYVLKPFEQDTLKKKLTAYCPRLTAL
ncbi:MAG: two-component system response regulator [Planctomycetaceae bacterium]|nr:two-component system response regulator [Planctomycetaceae bacterium]